jgi:hypothetical protein
MSNLVGVLYDGLLDLTVYMSNTWYIIRQFTRLDCNKTPTMLLIYTVKSSKLSYKTPTMLLIYTVKSGKPSYKTPTMLLIYTVKSSKPSYKTPTMLHIYTVKSCNMVGVL